MKKDKNGNLHGEDGRFVASPTGWTTVTREQAIKNSMFRPHIRTKVTRKHNVNPIAPASAIRRVKKYV